MSSIGFQIGLFLERIRTAAQLVEANATLLRERNNLQNLFVHAPAAVGPPASSARSRWPM